MPNTMKKPEMLDKIAKGGYKSDLAQHMTKGMQRLAGGDKKPVIADINDEIKHLTLDTLTELYKHVKFLRKRRQVLPEKSRWFGKECRYQCCKWEETEETGGPNYKDAHPVLVFCNHRDNSNPHEGNCTKKLCPEGAGDEAT